MLQAPDVTNPRMKGVKGSLAKEQIKRLIVHLHTCIRNTMAAIVKCAEDIMDKEPGVMWDSCFQRAIDHVFGLHAQCNAPAPQLSAIHNDSPSISRGATHAKFKHAPVMRLAALRTAMRQSRAAVALRGQLVRTTLRATL